MGYFTRQTTDTCTCNMYVSDHVTNLDYTPLESTDSSHGSTQKESSKWQQESSKQSSNVKHVEYVQVCVDTKHTEKDQNQHHQYLQVSNMYVCESYFPNIQHTHTHTCISQTYKHHAFLIFKKVVSLKE